MMRMKAKRTFNFNEVSNMLSAKGIILSAGSKGDAVEEAPGAYKNIEDIIQVVHESGIAERVVKLEPVGVIKG